MNNGEIKQAEYNVMFALAFAEQNVLTENESYYVNALQEAQNYINHLKKENKKLEEERESLFEQLSTFQECSVIADDDYS